MNDIRKEIVLGFDKIRFSALATSRYRSHVTACQRWIVCKWIEFFLNKIKKFLGEQQASIFFRSNLFDADKEK